MAEKNNKLGFGIILSIGMIISALILSKALYNIKASERFVTLKGLSVKEVDANLVIWPITFREASNNLNTLNNDLNKNLKIVENFVKKYGFTDQDVTISTPRLKDMESQEYFDPNRTKFRYFGEMTLTVRTNKISEAKQAMQKISELVDKGLIVVADNYERKTEFLFTGLNEIKPEMIEEATKNARLSAEKFAKDSGSEIGKIKKANQGIFTIRNRDRNTPEKKIIRVVSTIEFFIED